MRNPWEGQGRTFQGPVWMPAPVLQGDLTVRARTLAMMHYNARFNRELTVDDMDVVSFTQVLENWKGFIIPQVPGGPMYYITYDGQESKYYFMVYKLQESNILQRLD